MRTETLILSDDYRELRIVRYQEPFIGYGGIDLGKPVLLSSIDDGNKAFISDGRGIYHLFAGGHLAYIGVTNNFRRRLFEHRQTDKLFDAFLFFESYDLLGMNALYRIKRKMIEHYRPVLNLR